MIGTAPLISVTISPNYVYDPASASVDITQWVRDLSISRGRQHELDRTEASTLSLMLDNRDGRFQPWSQANYDWNPGGAPSIYKPTDLLTIGARIVVTATWAGTTYTVFTGWANSYQPSAPDEMNSDCTLQASDSFRAFSQTRVSNSNLYKANQLATGGQVPIETWRLNDNPVTTSYPTLWNSGVTAICTTAANLSSTTPVTLTFTTHSLLLTMPGSIPSTGGTFTFVQQGNRYTIAYTSWTLASGTFTFRNCRLTANTGLTSRTYTAASAGIVTDPGFDYIEGGWATAGLFGPNEIGTVYRQPGPFTFDPESYSIDFSAGQGSPQIQMGIPGTPYSAGTTTGDAFTVEAWIKNPSPVTSTAGNVVGDVLVSLIFSTADRSDGNLWSIFLNVGPSGQIVMQRQQITSSATGNPVTNVNAIGGPSVTDGNWHLVTLSVSLDATAHTPTAIAFLDGIYIGSSSFSGTWNSITPRPGWGTLPYGTTTSFVPIARSVALFAEAAFLYDSGQTYAYSAHRRFRAGSLLISSTAVANITGTPTITQTSNTTLTVDSVQGFSPKGGMAFVGLNTPVTFTGLSYTAPNTHTITGVNVAKSASVSSYTVGSSDRIYSVQPKTTGIKIAETIQATYGGRYRVDGSNKIVVDKTTSPTSITLDAGVVPCADETSSAFNTSLLDYLFQFGESEIGFIFVDSTGALRFFNRFYPQTHTKTTQALQDQAANDTDANYTNAVEVGLDDLDIWTLAQVSSSLGNVSYTPAQNPQYLVSYGPRTWLRGQFWGRNQVDSDAIGSMVVNRYSAPLERIKKVAISSSYSTESGATPNQGFMLAAELWDQVRFYRDTFGVQYGADVVIEHIKHDFRADEGEWRTEMVLSPYEMNGTSVPNVFSFFRFDNSLFQTAASNVAYAVTVPSSSSVSVQVDPLFQQAGYRPYDSAWMDTWSASGGPIVLYHAGSAYNGTYSGRARIQTTTSTVGTLTTASSVTLTLASVTNFPTGGGVFYLKHGATTYPCSYTAVSGSTIQGCKLTNTRMGSTVTTASGDAVYGPGLILGVSLNSGSVNLTAGDLISQYTVNGQDTFGG